jgi:hypothetical protein
MSIVREGMYECIEDFIMNSGGRAFTKGKRYEFEEGDSHAMVTVDDQDDTHYMERPDMEGFKFIK